jgi:hypothetical protein
MWMVVGMAGSAKRAAQMQKTLEEEGILVKLRNVTAKTRSNGDTIEVLVLESEAAAARKIIVDHGL